MTYKVFWRRKDKLHKEILTSKEVKTFLDFIEKANDYELIKIEPYTEK